MKLIRQTVLPGAVLYVSMVCASESLSDERTFLIQIFVDPQ
jgi:hypothetical protein